MDKEAMVVKRSQPRRAAIVDIAELCDRVGVFHDRRHAGEVLSGLLSPFRKSPALVLAIPAGGVPVAVAIVERLRLPLDLAVVSKITPPWNTEAGYGAVAFDGTVKLNEPLLRSLGLNREEIEAGIERTREKVMRRVENLRGDEPFPNLLGQTTILVDDGLASGFTMRVAVEVLAARGPGKVVVAVPTGSVEAVHALACEADAVYCANVRSGRPFAVADAYQQWSDVSEEELVGILAEHARRCGQRGTP